jgi:hypothetical protein
MGNRVELKYSVRPSNTIKGDIDKLEATYPYLRGFVNEIVRSLDGQVVGCHGDRRVIPYFPRQKAGPNEPMHYIEKVDVFLRYDTTCAYIEGLLFCPIEAAIGIAEKILKLRRESGTPICS